MSHPQGSYVFVPDEEECFLAAVVESSFDGGKAGAVKLLESGRRVRLSAGQTRDVVTMDAQSLDGLADMVQLKQLDEASILHNLRMRYEADSIYTQIGSILVSVNPFKLLPIYSPEMVDAYVSKGAREMPPHVYGVADNAYRALTGFARSQSVIISGESGAGKTEAAKLFLQYVGEKSGALQQQQLAASGQLQEQILEANPLMEAFGNAKTVRNDNSSRFGKLIEVHMDNKRGTIVGGSITQYLLEKSRLVQQAEAERNYHVFYQVCAAASMDPELHARYGLKEADQYFYLNQSTGKASTVVAGVNDAHEWANTVQAMEVLGLSAEERADIVQTLAGILHLGNVRFSGSEEKSAVENDDVLAVAAEQLGAKPAALAKALCMRNRGNAKESVYSNQGVTQAKDSRDALAKAVYSRLFDWLIAKINDALSAGGSAQAQAQAQAKPRRQSKMQAAKAKAKVEAARADRSTIGVLDIFGFESFVRNSYEQLCINYCNEKLQGHFNEHIFRLEQDEYRREGVDVSQISFVDNGAVLLAIEDKATGVLSILDEENRLPRGSDEGFLAKVLAQKKHEGVVSKPDMKRKGSRSAFVVLHYAGDVTYDASGFLEKNQDLLLTDLAALGAKSTFAFVATLFGSGGGGGGGAGQRRGAADPNKKTIGTQFKEQLKALMQTLDSTDPHYIRCIKPNADKAPGSFAARMCLDQLRYAGLLEVCRIRKTGYPVRKDFGEFVHRYRPLAPDLSLKANGGKANGGKDAAEALGAALQGKGLLAPGHWQAGKSKVFLRTDQFDELEASREDAVRESVAQMQKLARGFVARRRFRSFKAFFASLAKATKTRDAAALEAALLGAGVLPFQGRHLPEVKAARTLLDRLREEARVGDMLEGAMRSGDRSALESAIAAATDMDMGRLEVVKRAQKSLARLGKQKAASAALRDAVQARDAKALKAAIKAAAALELQTSPDFKDAEALEAHLREEAAALAQVDKAIKSKDASALRALLPRMAELGLEQHPTTQQAQGLAKAEAKRSSAAQEKMRMLARQLEDAIDHRDARALEQLARQAIELGMKGSAVDEANRLREELLDKAEFVSQVTAAMKALDIRAKGHDGIVAKDIAPLSAAIQRLSDEGFDAEEEEMAEAIAFEERMQHQLEVQALVADALKDNSDAALKKVMGSIQEAGLETGAAQQVMAEVRSRAVAFTSTERAAAAKDRATTRKQLREATGEEQLKDALMRVVMGGGGEAHSARVTEAADNSRFDFRKYYRIRADEDFTEFTPADLKPQYAEFKLKCQSKPIPKSVLDLDADLSRTAVQNHKAILQYCGELSNSFPTAMAGYVLVRGQETPELADEIYMQLMKQLTGNARATSEDRTWALMCMCSRAFPPSPDMELFVFNFLINHRGVPGLIGNYARLCLVQLSCSIQMGASEFLPDMDQVESYAARPAILAEIAKQNGEIMEVPVCPDHDVGYVLEVCNQSAEVADDEEQLFTIFVIDGKQRSTMDLHTRLERYYRKWNPSKLAYIDYFATNWEGNEETLFQTLEKKYGPEPGPDEDLDGAFGADAGAGADGADAKGRGRGRGRGNRNRNKAASKHYLRLPVTAARYAVKMIGLGSEAAAEPPAPETAWPLPWWAFLGDVYIRMVKQGREPVMSHKRQHMFPEEKVTDDLFLQVRDEVRAGDLPVHDEAEMAKMVLIDLTVGNGGKKIAKFKGKSLMDAIVEVLPVRALSRLGPSEWESLIKQAQEILDLPRSVQKLQAMYFSLVKDSRFFSSTFYWAQAHATGANVVIGVNLEGVQVMDPDRQDVVQAFDYGSIAKFGASGAYFWLHVDDGKTEPCTLYYRTITPWSLYQSVYATTHIVANRLETNK